MITYQTVRGNVRIPNLLKWAGGKNNLVEKLLEAVPESFGTYYEPFFGGGSLFWNLKLMERIENAVISDINPELVNLLQVIQSRPVDLIAEISNFKDLRGTEHFYSVRSEFNSLIGRTNRTVERAAMFIYLNRNGYNGLWRTNRKGEYNVPCGFYDSFHLPLHSEIFLFNQLLEQATIQCCNYTKAIKYCNKDDLVYLDPPYLKAKPSNFTQYAKEGFNLGDHRKLANCFRSLNKREVMVMTTNRESKEVYSLYAGYPFTILENRWSINRNGSDRNGKRELLITNF